MFGCFCVGFSTFTHVFYFNQFFIDYCHRNIISNENGTTRIEFFIDCSQSDTGNDPERQEIPITAALVTFGAILVVVVVLSATVSAFNLHN